MPNAFVRMKAEQSTTSVSSFTTSAMTVGAGNAIVSCTSAYADIELATTDSRGDVFRRAANERYTFGIVGASVSLEAATNVVGGSTTFTVTPETPATVSICAQEYSGMAVNPLETASHGHMFPDPSVDLIPGTLTPPTPGDLYVSAWTHLGVSDESFTPTPGFTLRANLTLTANQPLGSQEFIGSGDQPCIALLSMANYSASCAAAFKAADATTPDMAPNFSLVDFPMANRGFND